MRVSRTPNAVRIPWMRLQTTGEPNLSSRLLTRGMHTECHKVYVYLESIARVHFRYFSMYLYVARPTPNFSVDILVLSNIIVGTHIIVNNNNTTVTVPLEPRD